MHSKRGVPILPESGDIAIGIDALPVFQYLGDMFNGTAGNANMGFNWVSDIFNSNNIYVQYYLEDKTSVRVGLRLGSQNFIDREFVMKDAPVPYPHITVTDRMLTSNTNVNLGASYLMHRGKGRVQGYYGAGAMLLWQQTNEKYNYGNAITTEFNAPRTTDFGNNITGTGRLLNTSNLTRLGIAAHAFIGVEYFFAPKISVGGEYAIGFMALRTTGGQVTEERWTGTAIEHQTYDMAKDSEITLDNFNNGASIFLKFHF
ncbi:MAG: hypothetical protein GX879_02370 [Bacteroidales bacterium]|nr:hypothetical protein [Bacteroidales bacterium]